MQSSAETLTTHSVTLTTSQMISSTLLFAMAWTIIYGVINERGKVLNRLQ